MSIKTTWIASFTNKLKGIWAVTSNKVLNRSEGGPGWGWVANYLIQCRRLSAISSILRTYWAFPGLFIHLIIKLVIGWPYFYSTMALCSRHFHDQSYSKVIINYFAKWVIFSLLQLRPLYEIEFGVFHFWPPAVECVYWWMSLLADNWVPMAIVLRAIGI